MDTLMTREECAALRGELAALREESRQWEKTSLVEILKERDQLREERDGGYEYLCRLFKSWHPECIPLPTLSGIVTQIDNACCGDKRLLEDARSAMNEHMEIHAKVVNELKAAQARIAELEGEV